MTNILQKYQVEREANLRGDDDKSMYYYAKHKENHSRVVLKRYQVSNRLEEDKINNEINVSFKAMSASPNGVVKLFKDVKSKVTDPFTQVESTFCYLIQQYVKRTLKDIILERIQNNNPFSKQELVDHFKQLINTFADLQDSEISHGKIELDRIFEEEEGKPLLVGNFQRAKNQFGVENSELFPFNLRDFNSCQFPDRDQLEALLSGNQNINLNLYKMDSYQLGIVFTQMAFLEIFEDSIHFERRLPVIKEFLPRKYGPNFKYLIESLLAPRKDRPDFLELKKTSEMLLNQDSVIGVIFHSNSPSVMGSQRPKRLDQETGQSELRPDLDSEISNNFNGLESWNIREPLSNIYQTSQYQSFRQKEIDQSVQAFSLMQGSEIRAINHDNQHLQQMMPEIAESRDVSHEINLTNLMGQISSPNKEGTGFNSNYQFISVRSEVPIQDNIPGSYADEYFQRSSKIREQNISNEELNKKVSKFQNLKFIEQKNLTKIGKCLGQGKKSTVYECDMTERNFCVVKQYHSLTNKQILDMLTSLNNTNHLKINLAIKVEGVYLNNFQENQDDKIELWLIQKKKVYNLKNVRKYYILGMKEKLNIVYGIVNALIELHENNITHGGLKPENILLDQKFNPYLTDFGFAEITQGSQMTSSRFCEVGYSSPEQYNDMQVCKNSDIWSLGIIFQEFMIDAQISDQFIKQFGLYDPSMQGCIDIDVNSDNKIYRIFALLIKGMTQFNPDKRISLKQIKEELKKLQNSVPCDRQTKKIPEVCCQIQNDSPIFGTKPKVTQKFRQK